MKASTTILTAATLIILVTVFCLNIIHAPRGYIFGVKTNFGFRNTIIDAQESEFSASTNLILDNVAFIIVATGRDGWVFFQPIGGSL